MPGFSRWQPLHTKHDCISITQQTRLVVDHRMNYQELINDHDHIDHLTHKLDWVIAEDVSHFEDAERLLGV
jgi:hypothetical protein